MSDSHRGDARDPTSGTSAENWERLSTMFEAAMALPLDTREQYVNAACLAHPELHADLQALVAAAHGAPEFLTSFARDVVGPGYKAAHAVHDDNASDAASPNEAVPSSVGSRIRHYDVRARLGQGGMGVVYVARDTRLERDVALKFLAPSRVRDQRARQQILHEARAISALDDPNVCPLYAIEDADDGGLCLVMAYCGGGTLRERLRRGLLPVETTLEIAAQLASGLACAHRNGIVHRDLKPANVGFGDRDVAKILDFGIAVRTDTVTTAGAHGFVGTTAYLAPEVLRGHVADSRADVWALGVTMYEMLTGRRPFSGITDSAILYAIYEQDVPSFERADAVTIPADVKALVCALLEKSPDARPRNGAEVLARIRGVQESAVAGTPASTPTTVAKFGTGWTRAVAAVVLIGFVTMVVVLSRSASRATGEQTVEVARSNAPLPTVAVLPFAVRGGAQLEYLRDCMVDLLTPALDGTGLLHGVDPNAVLGATTNFGRRLLDSTETSAVVSALGASRFVSGSIVGSGVGLTVRATMFRASGEEEARASVAIASSNELSKAVDAVVRQLIAAELRAPGDTMAAVAASGTSSSRALRDYLDGERELRDARPAAAVDYFQRAVAGDSLFALAWYRLARAAKWSEVDSLNAFATDRAFSLAGTLPLRSQAVVRAYHALRRGRPSDAERQLRQIVADYPTDVDAWMLLGELLFEQNPYHGRPTADAVAAFRTVMKLDPRNREVTVYLMELAARADRVGELDTLFSMYFRPNSAGEQPGIRQTYLALHARRLTAAGVRVAAAPRVDDGRAAQIALRRVGSARTDLDAARTFATTLTASGNSTPMRVEGLLALASLDDAAVQPTNTSLVFREAALLDPDRTMLHAAYLALAPTRSVSADSLRSLRRALSEPVGVSNNRTALDATIIDGSVRNYLVGMLSLQLADSAAVARATLRLADVKNANGIPTALANCLRAHVAFARGRFEDAARLFDLGIVDVPEAVRAQSPVLLQYAERYAHADALRALGRRSEAMNWNRSLLDGPALWGAPYLAAARAQERRLREQLVPGN